VSNTGILAARDFKVEIFAFTPQYGNLLVGSAVVAEVPPLSTFNVGLPVDTSRLLGQTDLLIYVDRLDKVLETSENNNQTSLKIFVKQDEPADAVVLTRKPFYRGSSFVTQHPSGGANHDTAIATDKVALRPGESSSPANVISYSAGLNGIVVDIAGTADVPTLSDFQFRVGNSSDTSGWLPAPTPDYFLVRFAAGEEESTRIEIGWPDGAIAHQWLEVTILANDVTNLPSDDVAYFGHADGETGNLPDDFRVDGADVLLVEQNATDSAAIDNAYDFNRDGRVDDGDRSIAVAAQNAPLGDLDRDDRVGLSDVARLQAAQGRSPSAGYYDGDLTGDARIDRSDAATLAKGFGQVSTTTMLAERLQPIVPSAVTPSGSAASAVFATVVAEFAQRLGRLEPPTDHAARDVAIAARRRRCASTTPTRVVGAEGDDTYLPVVLAAHRLRALETRRRHRWMATDVVFARGLAEANGAQRQSRSQQTNSAETTEPLKLTHVAGDVR
jgi:hypothetical protein